MLTDSQSKQAVLRDALAALMDPAMVDDWLLAPHPDLGGRILRDGWIEQAVKLSLDPFREHLRAVLRVPSPQRARARTVSHT